MKPVLMMTRTMPESFDDSEELIRSLKAKIQKGQAITTEGLAPYYSGWGDADGEPIGGR